MKTSYLLLIFCFSIILISCYGGGTGIERTCENQYGLNSQTDLILTTQEQVDLAFTQTHVRGNVYIGTCPDMESSSITNLNGLRNLKKIDGSLLISETDISIIQELDQLEEIGGVLSFYMNSSLKEIKNINSLRSVNELSFFGNEDLLTIYGFNALTHCNNTLSINGNGNLETIEGFNNLLHIGGDLSIESNSKLVKLKGFEQLNEVGQNILLRSNIHIHRIEAFNNLMSIGEDLDLRYNWNLETMGFFKKLNRIDGRLIIENHKELKSLPGLSNLIFLGNQLYIADNLKLSDYCGLTPLIQTEGGLSVGDNGPPYNVPYFVIENNLFNPSRLDLFEGNCLQ